MRSLLATLLVLSACVSTPEPLPTPVETKPAPPPPKVLAEAPTLRLPEWARPTAYTLNVRVIPGEDGFSGEMALMAAFEQNNKDLTRVSGN